MSQPIIRRVPRRRLWPAVVLALVLAGAAVAGDQGTEAGPDARPSSAPAGEQTRAWLQLQRDGDQASAYVQGLPEAARTRALKRYLDSFTHPIPETYFDRDSFGVD